MMPGMRPARMVDVPRLVELLAALHRRTRYADVPMDDAVARRLFAQAVQRDGHTHDGGTLVRVWEEAGRIVGFIVGMLDRVYHVGRKLWAQDLFLHVEPGASRAAMPALFRAFLAWAEANPLVHEIRPSWSDAAPGGARMARVYQRAGFVECGRVYRREVVR